MHTHHTQTHTHTHTHMHTHNPNHLLWLSCMNRDACTAQRCMFERHVWGNGDKIEEVLRILRKEEKERKKRSGSERPWKTRARSRGCERKRPLPGFKVSPFLPPSQFLSLPPYSSPFLSFPLFLSLSLIPSLFFSLLTLIPSLFFSLLTLIPSLFLSLLSLFLYSLPPSIKQGTQALILGILA